MCTSVGTIDLRNVSKSFGGVVGLQGLNLHVGNGEVLALSGPSGCGKSTTLRMIAGLDTPDSGEIHLHGREVTAGKPLPPHKRGIGMVFQDLALWPHMTAGQQVAFGMPRTKKKQNRKDRKQAVMALLRMVRMEKAERYPHQLSGGERQRLALARALASEPKILLLDEPFSSLDRELKEELLIELRLLVRNLKITTVYVTHQLEETLGLADRVARMAEGRILEIVAADSIPDCRQNNNPALAQHELANSDSRKNNQAGGSERLAESLADNK